MRDLEFVSLNMGESNMDRVERVRKIIDEILLNMTDHEERRCAYLHLYGVSQACALLSIKRKENVELIFCLNLFHYNFLN